MSNSNFASFTNYLNKYDDSFRAIKEFNTKLSNKKENEEFMSYQGNPRFDVDKYFYFPFEDESITANCFENSVAMYLAIKYLKPESSPRMFFLDEGERGVHSICVFNHDNLIYMADPNYHCLTPTYIQKNAVYGLRDDEGNEKKIEFKSLREIEPEMLKSKIARLRSSKGIIDYFSHGGQVFDANITGMLPYESFGFFKDGKLILEKRIQNLTSKLNLVSRAICDIENDEQINEICKYTKANWKVLEGEKMLLRSRFKGEKFISSETSTFKEMGKSLSDLLFINSLYFYELRKKAQKQKKNILDTRYFNKKDREFTRDEYNKKGLNDLLVYLGNYSKHYLEHVLEFSIFCGESIKMAKEDYSHIQRFRNNGSKLYINSCLMDIALGNPKLYKFRQQNILKKVTTQIKS